MTCVLVAVLWGQSFSFGLYKVCAYDCGQERPSHVWYDKAYIAQMRSGRSIMGPEFFFRII